STLFPYTTLFRSTHEHFVTTERVRAVLFDDVVGIHDVPARLRHFLAVLAEYDSLIHQSLKRFGLRNMTEIKKHFVPEARVEQMQDRMLGSADIKIDSPRMIPGRPIFFRLFANETFVS